MQVIIKTVILKEGMPSVEQARARLNAEINAARQSGVKLLKIVHGYGSTGVGGDLRIALQSTLAADGRKARDSRLHLRRKLAQRRRAKLGAAEADCLN